MPETEDETALRSFLGSVNQLLRYLEGLSDLTEPLNAIPRDDSDKVWRQEHTDAFEAIKKKLVSPMVLAHYDASLPTRLTSDASQYGAGAVLEQLHGKEWKPVQFMSCRFSPTQQRYAMIEKEACVPKVHHRMEDQPRYLKPVVS